MATFNFVQFDPRPIPAAAEANEAVFATGPVFGIEVTIPALAARCVNNLDHHGPEDNAKTPSAAEQALTCPLPPAGSTLATVRVDTDSVAAMAILALRAGGRDFITPVPGSDYGGDLLARGGERRRQASLSLVEAIGAFDRLGPAAGRPRDEVIAIGRVAADFKRTLTERVAWVQRVVVGMGDPAEIAALVATRDAEFEAARKASEVSLHAEGRICLVVSSHRFGTNLGYEKATVVVAYNPEMAVNFKDPGAGTYKKYTVCRYDSHVPCDLTAAMAELNTLDPAVTPAAKWGGRGDIGGSPQGVSSQLTPEQVVEIVAKHLK